MIVKITQLPEHKDKVFISDEHNKLISFRFINDDIKDLLHGRLKAYFTAKIVNNKIQLMREITGLNW
jgi:hypothetical protein